MTLRTGKSKGSITVYLSMIMLLVLSLVTAFLESARVQVASLDMQRCLTGSMDAVLTNYYKPLYKDYRVLFMDKGIESDSLEYRKIAKEIQEYMNASMSTEASKELFGITWKESGLSLYQSQLDMLQVDSAIRATDYNGDIFMDQVLQYMKYEALGDEIQNILDKFGLMEETETISSVMEEETKIEEKFEKANEYLIEIMELVEGISYNDSGLEYASNGLLKIKDSFAKKLCVGAFTKKNAGVDNDVVWGSVKSHYVSPVTMLTKMKNNLEKCIKQAEKQKEQEEEEKQKKLEEAAKAEEKQKTEEKTEEQIEEEKRKKEEEKRKEEEKKKQQEEEKSEQKERIKEINATQKELKNLVQDTKDAITQACKKIDKLKTQQGKIEASVKEYKASLKSKKDKLSKEQYENMQKTAKELDKDVKNIRAAIGMKTQLEANLKLLDSLEKELKTNVSDDEKIFQEKFKQVKTQIQAMSKYSIKSLKFSYGKIPKKEETKNPSNILKDLGSSVLDLVVSDSSKISKKSIDNPDYYYQKYKGKSKGAKNIDTGKVASSEDAGSMFSSIADTFGGEKELKKIGNDITNSLLFQSYIKSYFGSYVSAGERFDETPLDYEQEYILCGEKSDKENLKQIINRILLLRTITNFTYLLSDTSAREKAYATAALLVGFTGVEPVIRLAQTSILIVWAYEESLVDVAALLQGKSIPMIASKNTFMLSYSDIFTISKSKIQSKAKQLGKKTSKAALKYEDYLNLFLLFENQTQKTYRTMDMVDENMKLRHSDLFSLEKCIYTINVKCNYQIPAKFALLGFVDRSNLKDNAWNFSVSKEYSY